MLVKRRRSRHGAIWKTGVEAQDYFFPIMEDGREESLPAEQNWTSSTSEAILGCSDFNQRSVCSMASVVVVDAFRQPCPC